MTRFALIFSLTAVLVCPGAASADTIQLASDGALSTEQLGAFSGSLSYDASTGHLTISLSNISEAANGGYITAFALNQPQLSDADRAAMAFSANPSSFNLIFDPATPPEKLGGDKSYEFGASTSDNWLGNGRGAGPPSNGIGVGESGSFVFDFSQTSSSWGAWTAESFISAHPILVRFRGFEDGGSDKVPGHAVPEPSTWAMGLLALLVLGGLRRRG